MACDPYWNKTVLACHFDGANGSTTFTDEKGHALTANGNAQISTAQSKFGGSSLSVNGNTGGNVSSSSSDFDLSTAVNFTIEAFVSVGAWDTYSYFVSKGNGSTRSWAVALNQTTLYFYWSTNGSADSVFSATVPSLSLNTFYHIAVVKEGTALRIYLDGVQKGTATFTSMYSSTGPMRIGAFMDYTGISHCLNGFVDDLRITKAARYVSNFTPPTQTFVASQCAISGTVKDAAGAYASKMVRAFRRDTAALIGEAVSDSATGAYSIQTESAGEHFVVAHDAVGDALWSNVALACHFNGTNGSTAFTDEKGNTLTAGGNAQISTAQSKFGGSSALFDGASDYIAVLPETVMDFTAGAATVDCWIRVSSLATASTIYQSFTNTGGMNGHSFFINTNGGLGVYAREYYVINHSTNPGTIAINTWYHIALVIYGLLAKIYVNGVLVASGSFSNTTGLASANRSWIGGDIYGGATNGHIEDFRITKAVRWSGDFTPPTQAFLGGLSGGTENAVILDRILPA